MKELVRGRLGVLEIKYQDSQLSLVNIHVDPQINKNRFVSLCKEVDKQMSDRSRISFWMGDLNFVNADEGRMDLEKGEIIYGEEWKEKDFFKILDYLCEVAQPDYTRRQVKIVDGRRVPTQLARLDRAFTNVHSADIGDMGWSARVFGKAPVVSSNSDHTPIFLTAVPPRFAAPRTSNVPHWVVDHPLFSRCLQRCTEGLIESHPPKQVS